MIDFRQGNPTQPGNEADGTDLALFAADAAVDVLPGKTVLANRYAEKPGSLAYITPDGTGRARLCAIATESAVAEREISDRKAAFAFA
jgi:hypothetical protein